MVASVKLPGAHRNVRQRAGRVLIYWNAWRGGPALGRFEGATLAEAEAAETAGAAKLAERYAEARQATAEAPKTTLKGIVIAYKAAPDGFLKLGADTQAKWSPWLDRISDETVEAGGMKINLGTMPVVVLKAKGTRRIIKAWRNRWAATPRTADYGIQVLRRVLNWALDEELVEANPALGIDELYQGGRACEIVEKDEFEAILQHATPPSRLFFRLAAATGLRRGDLRALRWSDIDGNSISLATGKSGGDNRVIVPLLDVAHLVLLECRRHQARIAEAAKKAGKLIPAWTFVAVTERGKQWSKDGPTGAWVKAAKEAKVDKHLHDLRGNHATMLMAKGFTDEQIAEVMGWSDVDDVRKIRRRYVDRNRIAQDMIDQIRGRS